MSASRSPTRNPAWDMATATFTAMDDFPTPPLPDPMAMTLVVGETWVGSALARAFALATDMRPARCFLVIAVVRTST